MRSFWQAGRISIFEPVPHESQNSLESSELNRGINGIDRHRGRAELRLSPICFEAISTQVFRCVRSTFDLHGFAQAAVFHMGRRRSDRPTTTPRAMFHANSQACTPTKLHLPLKMHRN